MKQAGDNWEALHGMAERAIEHDDLLRSEHERHFVTDIVQRLEKWREGTAVTDKQVQWLHDIDERLDAERVDTDGVKPADEGWDG